MEISKEELATYLHGDEGYLAEWESIREWDACTFNFSAFFFGVLWMIYRKMYLPALLLLVNIVLIDITVEVVFLRILHTPLIIAKLFSLLFYIILFVLLGRQANRLYLQDAERKIIALKERNLPEASYLNQVQKAGGRHWQGLILVLALLAGIYFLESPGEIKASKNLIGPLELVKNKRF